jgi:hypothetical protein
LYWLSKPPAAPRVVANEEIKIPGVGVRAWSCAPQVAVSPETKVVSLLCGASPATLGVRREMVSTRLTAGLERRLERMWDP